jgi:hypothetical protein
VHLQQQILHVQLAAFAASSQRDALTPWPRSCTCTETTLSKGEPQMAKNTSVVGIYRDRTTVSEALNTLKSAGYRPADISVLASDDIGTKDFAHVKQNRALRGAAIGAAIGAVVGAGLAWLVSTQPVTVTALAHLVNAGPVLAVIAGAGAGGALGWIVGLLMGMRFTDYVAKRYAGRTVHGGILLSVHCDTPEWCDRARKTLKDTGARDISAAAESAADYGATDKPTERAPVSVAVRAEAPVLVTPVRVDAPVLVTAEDAVEIKK